MIDVKIRDELDDVRIKLGGHLELVVRESCMSGISIYEVIDSLSRMVEDRDGWNDGKGGRDPQLPESPEYMDGYLTGVLERSA